MEEFPLDDDLFSEDPSFLTSWLAVWSDFIDFIDDDTKGDIIES